MQVKAKAKYIRMSPRKVRLVADIVRGLDLEDALNRLAILNKKAVKSIEKLLKSALANAEHNYELSKDNLFIKEILVDDGPTSYRWMPRAHGRATQLRKRTSTIKITLEEKVATKKQVKAKKQEIETVQVKEKIGDLPIEKADVAKKTRLTKGAEEIKSEEDFDIKRKGGFRDMQQQEKGDKKSKGMFKKMFRRKSGM